MAQTQAIAVRCEPDPDGWRCTVTVGDDPGATRHEVAVRADYLSRLATTEASAESVVVASFAFMLEREPRESILRAFDLAVISRYFPEYEGEIRGRLGA